MNWDLDGCSGYWIDIVQRFDATIWRRLSKNKDCDADVEFLSSVSEIERIGINRRRFEAAALFCLLSFGISRE